MRKIFYLILISSVLVILSACSSMVTVKNPRAEQSDGLIYYMPKKDIVITFNVSEENNESESGSNKKKDWQNQLYSAISPEKRKIVSITNVDVTPAYPDGSKYYVLKHKINLLGDNRTDIGINEKGLLSSSTKSSMTSKVNEALANLAQSAGKIAAGITTLGVPGPAKEKTPPKVISCPEVGNYIFKIKFDDIEDRYTARLCDMDVDVIKVAMPAEAPSYQRAGIETKDLGESGIYYRQLIPYDVKITKNEKNSANVLAADLKDDVKKSEEE